jgi:hypothetical protein
MIQINLLHDAPVFLGALPRVEEVKRHRSPAKALLGVFLGLLLILGGGVGYVLFAGLPASVAPFVPPTVVALLGLSLPETSTGTAPGVVPESGSAVAVTPDVKPAVPGNDAVEEVVKTMRPDLFYMKERKEYRELLPSEKILHQKQIIAQAFSLFRSITPSTFGYSDLVFKNPDYFYVRGVASDAKSRSVFLDSLRTHSNEFTVLPQPDGNRSLEFTSYGRLQITGGPSGERLALLTPSQVVAEVTSLNELAQKNQVRLKGLDNPQVTSHGLYRRILYHAQTSADFPSLQQFTEAFRTSNLRIGILQVSIRPASDEGPAATFDFIVYTTPQ